MLAINSFIPINDIELNCLESNLHTERVRQGLPLQSAWTGKKTRLLSVCVCGSAMKVVAEANEATVSLHFIRSRSL